MSSSPEMSARCSPAWRTGTAPAESERSVPGTFRSRTASESTRWAAPGDSGGAPGPWDEAGEGRELELARADVARDAALERRRRAAREQGAPSQVRVELHMAEEPSATRGIDADVQQGAARVAFEVEVGCAEL